MAKIRKETTPAGTRYVVDGRYQLGGKRGGRREFFATRAEADDRLAEILQEARGPRRVVHDPKIALGEFLTNWLRDAALYLEPATLAQYTWAVGKLGDLAGVRVRDLDEPHVIDLVRRLMTGDRPLARKSVRHVLGAVHAGLQTAVGGLLHRNPLDVRGGKSLLQRFAPKQAETEERMRPLTGSELAAVMEQAMVTTPRYYPLWFTMSRTGLRPGEALGLQWGDIDYLGMRVRIVRSLRRSGTGRHKTPKAGRARTVPIGKALHALLLSYSAAEKARWLREGKEQPVWCFPSGDGEPMDPHAMFKAFRRVCLRAGVGDHSPYDLRHTFITRLLEQGVQIKQVAEWAGHADIRLTAHTYGKWARFDSPEAIDRLEDPGGQAHQTAEEPLAGSEAGTKLVSGLSVAGSPLTRK